MGEAFLTNLKTAMLMQKYDIIQDKLSMKENCGMFEWAFIYIIVIIIGVYVIRLYVQKQEIQQEQERNAKLRLSLDNANNAHKFVNKIGIMQTCGHQRYVKIYQKEFVYCEIMQVVYAVFYEDEYFYEMEYFTDKNKRFDINKDVSRFKLNCKMFIDGKELDPSLNEYIEKEKCSLKIEELNMRKHEGKGVGSFYLECLSKELLRYPQIKYMYGELSSVDFEKREKLIHFYRKNGFEQIIPMTEKKFGYVAKTIRLIDEDILKLKNKDMTFGIEIEFQLRSGHKPIEIAQEMYNLELSDRDEQNALI